MRYRAAKADGCAECGDDNSDEDGEPAEDR
jgi:hypothetical protein